MTKCILPSKALIFTKILFNFFKLKSITFCKNCLDKI